jgi:seryl-tRNA synthetase
MARNAGPASGDRDGEAAPEPWTGFRQRLFDSGLLVGTGVDGIYGRSAAYESIAEAMDRLVLRVGEDQQATTLRFPPVMAWSTFRQNGYLESFPNQMGSVHTFGGDARAHAGLLHAAETGEDRGPFLESTETVLCPAVCHPLYPTLTGVLPDGGRRFEVYGYCFRHEPSTDPFRMQSFRQHDYVFVGSPDGARSFRDGWLDRGLETLATVGLEVTPVVANDPFFGRPGRMLAANQLEERLKYELVAPVDTDARPVAISSSNCHLDHFGRPFGIRTADGGVAHSACFGFGIDRITLALVDRHGPDPGAWPTGVRAVLWS